MNGVVSQNSDRSEFAFVALFSILAPFSHKLFGETSVRVHQTEARDIDRAVLRDLRVPIIVQDQAGHQVVKVAPPEMDIVHVVD